MNNPSFYQSERTLILAGVLCVFAAMVLGFIYAAYISHVANAGIKEAWSGVMLAVSQADVELVKQHFAVIAELTEKRGRIMNSHSHLGGSGLLILAVAMLQPLSSLGVSAKRWVCCSLALGAGFQFVGVLLSYYSGISYIYLSDIGGILLLLGVILTLYGLLKDQDKKLSGPSIKEFIASRVQFSSSRYLIKAAVLLIFVLMMLGLYLAWRIVSGDEAGSLEAVRSSVEMLIQHDVSAAQAAIANFKMLQTKMAINAAAHSHGLELAILMILLAFLRVEIGFREKILKVWCVAFSAASYALPLCIFLAINYSFSFAKLANTSGVVLAVLLLILFFGFTKKQPLEEQQ